MLKYYDFWSVGNYGVWSIYRDEWVALSQGLGLGWGMYMVHYNMA